MADDERVYSDEEFAVILQHAAELASRAEPTVQSASGLTLREIKEVAAQVGIEPAFVERAARISATPIDSPIERLIGGPVRHGEHAHFSVKLDEKDAALLLSAMNIRAGRAGYTSVGHSSSMGMTWHDGGDVEALGVTAQPDKDGTIVTVVLDRRGTLALVTMVSGVATLFTLLFAGSALYPEAPALGVGGAVVGVSGVFALARSYWASSTKRVRQRINAVMEAVGQTLTQRETTASNVLPSGDGDQDSSRDANESESQS